MSHVQATVAALRKEGFTRNQTYARLPKGLITRVRFDVLWDEMGPQRKPDHTARNRLIALRRENGDTATEQARTTPGLTVGAASSVIYHTPLRNARNERDVPFDLAPNVWPLPEELALMELARTEGCVYLTYGHARTLRGLHRAGWLRCPERGQYVLTDAGREAMARCP